MSEKGEDPVYHLIDRTSSKQRGISYSSYGAEIMGCTGVDETEFYIISAFASQFMTGKFDHRLHVDSPGL